MELVRHFDDEIKDDLEWDVYLFPLDQEEYGRPNFLLVGHLFRTCDEGHGQVRASGVLRAYKSSDAPLSTEKVHQELSYGFVEPLYDACRRALEIQAANMDIDLDLPILSPAVVVELESFDDSDEDESKD